MRESIEKIEEANRIKFSHHEDDLDGFDAAVLMIEPATEASRSTKARAHDLLTDNFATGLELLNVYGSGLPLVFMLQRYDREADNNITVYLARGALAGDSIGQSVRRVLRALHIEAGAVIWEREHDPEL